MDDLCERLESCATFLVAYADFAEGSRTVHALREAAARIRQLEAEVAALPTLLAERRRLREAGKAFVSKLAECQPHIDSAFLMAFTRMGAEYSGPQYGEELAELKQALQETARD